MAKFKIGDKVKVIKSNRPEGFKESDLNAVGTIVEIYRNCYTIDFGEVKEFTWKLMKSGKKSGRIYHETEIELIEEVPAQNWKVVILPDGDKTTALYYENGKVAKKAEVKRYFKDEYSAKAAVQAVLEKLGIPVEKMKPDKMPVVFDWQKFIDGDLCVRFSCKEDYVEFLKLCEEKGLIWNRGEKPTKWVVWEKNRSIVHNGFKHEKETSKELAKLFHVKFNHLSMGVSEGDFEELSGRKVPVIDWKPEKPHFEPPFKVGDIVELIEDYDGHKKGTRGKISRVFQHEEADWADGEVLVEIITGKVRIAVFNMRLKKVN